MKIYKYIYRICCLIYVRVYLIERRFNYYDDKNLYRILLYLQISSVFFLRQMVAIDFKIEYVKNV